METGCYHSQRILVISIRKLILNVNQAATRAPSSAIACRREAGPDKRIGPTIQCYYDDYIGRACWNKVLFELIHLFRNKINKFCVSGSVAPLEIFERRRRSCQLTDDPVLLFR